MACVFEGHCSSTAPGDELRVVGAAEQLGNWDPQKSLRLSTTAETYPCWSTQLDAPLLAGTEFKLAILRKGGRVDWEEGSNRCWPSSATGQVKICLRFNQPLIECVEIPSSSGCAADKPKPEIPASSGYAADKPKLPVITSSSDTTPCAPSPTKGLRKKLISSDCSGGSFQDRFEMMSNLGEGGFGIVRKAKDKSTGALRAVKTVEKARCFQIDDLIKEVQLSLTMDHPNVVRLFGMYDDPTHIYLVMEICEGGELFDRIVEAGHLQESTVQTAMRHMLRSVAYCHGMNIAHRDLKPENFILQTKEPLEKASLKLIDFGLAKSCKDGETLKSAVGTVHYVAPEILAQSYNKKVDVWSLGVIMYCLLCGTPPFCGATDRHILANIKRGQYSIDGEKWKPVSQEAKSLLSCLLKKDSDARLTAKGALENTWFKKGAAALSKRKLHASLSENLRHFTADNRFKKAAMIAIAYHLNEDEERDIRQTFTQIDADGDGVVTSEELLKGAEECPELKELLPNLEALVADINANNDGRLEYTEFIAAFMDSSVRQKEDLCRRAFATFDTDNSGMISKSELKQIVDDDSFQKSIPGARGVSFFFDQADTNQDGEISLDEFMVMLQSDTPVRKKSSFYRSRNFGDILEEESDEK